MLLLRIPSWVNSGMGSSFSPNTHYACAESFGQAYYRKKSNKSKDGDVEITTKNSIGCIQNHVRRDN